MNRHRFLNFLPAIMGVALLVASLCAPEVSLAQYAGRPDNWRDRGQVVATPASTFATTSYADLPGATLTFTPTRDPTQTEAPSTSVPAERLIVDWNLDVIKATATTGTCGVFANGALIANSARTIDFAAKNTTMGGTYEVTLTGAGSQVVKLQCKSGDTNVLTVNFGQAQITEVY